MAKAKRKKDYGEPSLFLQAIIGNDRGSIAGSDEKKKTARKDMTAEDWKRAQEGATRQYLEAIKNGTHSLDWQGVICTRCREWCHPFHYNPQATREHFCRKCCVIMGVSGAKETVALGDAAITLDELSIVDTPLPAGVSRVEDIGLPEQ